MHRLHRPCRETQSPVSAGGGLAISDTASALTRPPAAARRAPPSPRGRCIRTQCSYKKRANEPPKKWPDRRRFTARDGEEVMVGGERFRELTCEGYYATHHQTLKILGLPAGDESAETIPGGGPVPASQAGNDALWRPLWSDRYFAAVEKHPGLLSAPGKTVNDSLVTRLNSTVEFSRARIAHRLDRDTSGVMVLALSAKSLSALSVQFQDRRTRKVYQALVHGWIEEDEGVIDLPIGKDPDPEAFPRMRVDEGGGRPSQTAWRVLERLESPVRRTRVELRPVTGRSHQLRLHMKAIGHPILGDTIHAPPGVAALCSRLCLHAEQLEVDHPWHGDRMAFEAPCPF